MEIPPTIKVYTDSCRIGGKYGQNYMSFAWLAIFPDGTVLGPRTERRLKPRGNGVHDETLPKDAARQALANQGPLKIHTDHPTASRPDEVTCNKRDPWHLVCHYAALNSSLRGERRQMQAPRKKPKKHV